MRCVSARNQPKILLEMEQFCKTNNHVRLMVKEICRYPVGECVIERMSLKTQAIQRIDDIVMFHRFAMSAHKNNGEVVDSVFEQFNSDCGNLFDDIEDDLEMVSGFRMVSPNFNHKEQNRRVGSLADESLVINLWATIEQFTNRCLGLYYPGRRLSHKWHEIENYLRDRGLNVSNALSYQLIDELRVLNNVIKHSYVVDKKHGKKSKISQVHFGCGLGSISYDIAIQGKMVR